MLLLLNFKIFNKAPLNKTILFLLDRKFVSTSRMKNSLRKRFHLREKLFSLPVISDKWGNGFSLARKTVLLGAIKFFCKNWLPHNYNNGFHLQKKYY